MTRADLAVVARLLQSDGLSTHQIAARLHYSRSYIDEVLRDPEGLKRKRDYWRKRTPLQRAASRLEPFL